MRNSIIIKEDQIIIPFSKIKLTLMFLGSLMFVVLGLIFIISPTYLLRHEKPNSILLFSVGLTSVMFFGMTLIYLLGRIINNKPGLIITKNGIIDNSGGVSIGQIYWSEIKDISIYEIKIPSRLIITKRLIKIKVKNPQKFINRQSNYINKKILSLNNRFFGSTISITTSIINIKLDDLYKLLTDNFNIYLNNKEEKNI